MSRAVLRVLIADDQRLVREGVRKILAGDPAITVVGEAVDGPSALALAGSLKPDLVVLDNHMPGLSGLDVTRTLARDLPDIGTVFLTVDPSSRDLALAAGATTYVQKDAPPDELLRAVHAAAAALTVRRRLSDVRPEWRRVLELLLGSRALSQEQAEAVVARSGSDESMASALLRLGFVNQDELADVLARVSGTPLVSLAPYPEIVAPIDPTESRISSPRLVDPVEREAARRLPLDVARSLGVVVTAVKKGEGVLAMADPLDMHALGEAQRLTRLRFEVVTATADDVAETLERMWTSTAPGPVVSLGDIPSRLETNVLVAVISIVWIAGFAFLFRDALQPRFGLSLLALLCGFFFFVYALRYYVISATVLFIALFGDSLRLFRRKGTAASLAAAAPRSEVTESIDLHGRIASDADSGGQHREGYRTLRGEKLDQAGTVVVADPWQRLGEFRLPAERQPFVSVQVALYNEARVVDRLLEACTSFDYENYEVIVADDSTDETVELLRRWNEHPRVRVLHRESRNGFKGGALQEALGRMNPRTEYVVIFDADFVPPADAIWHFLDYFGRLGPKKAEHHAASANGVPVNGDRLAAVQGYQWHMLNASENWITKGVRAEFAGSYVLERTGQELFGAMKMISGSVYMIRADVLRKLGWSTSITEDWELTIRLYLAGYKVLYTPYIQAPAECVSQVGRLIKQRMRWAEGHTYNVKKYFFQVISSPNLSFKEKLEFCFYAPYYLQSVLFSFGTLTWLLGTFVFHQKLPMWGELFGWSLIVSNALALPLMNLAGVLLEGSLRRDAFGLLSFIGLSWLLVPFQAYASLKALFERKEGGWVRTPKSGHITEAVGRFRLARLMPWELPKRSKAAGKPSRLAQFGLAAAAVLVATGIITVGALSVRAVAASGTFSDADLAIPAVLGTAVPLLTLALLWLRLRRRFTALALAFTLGLGTNVAFLAHAVPAQAVTDNSSVFTFQATPPATSFVPGYQDMTQHYSPSVGTATTCPTSAGFDLTCTFGSDAFSAGQTMNAGTAQADLYLENNPTITLRSATTNTNNASNCSIFKPAGIANGDVILAACGIRGGSGTTITSAPSGWTLAGSRVDNGTTLSLFVYWHTVSDASTEPSSYSWGLSAAVKSASGAVAYSGLDSTNPIDVSAGQATSSGTSHTALSVNTGAANEMLVTFHTVAGSTGGGNQWTPPPAMSCCEREDIATNTQGASSNVGLEANDLLEGAAGATGNQTATSTFSGVGATLAVALKQPTGTRTCNVTVALKRQSPIWLRSFTTNTVDSGLSITLDKPAGAQQNDVLVLVVANGSGGTFTEPSGFTFFSWTSGLSTAWHVVGASDPGPWTWSISGAQALVGWLGAYAGVDPTNPADPTAPNTTTSGTSHSTNSLSPMSTAGSYEMVIATFRVSADATWTPPSDMLEVADFKNAAGTMSLEVDHAIQSAAGPSGVKTATSSASGSGSNVIFALNPIAANTTTVGTTTVSVNGPGGPTLVSTGAFATSAVTFANLDRLIVDVVVPNNGNCGVRISFDSTGQPSKLTVATIVPEGVIGLLLLAPALPFGARWWKRRRP